MNNAPLTVSEFINITNDLLACNFETVLITGEVASFKVNQGKWVFFDIKDEEASVSCFMPVWQLKVPLEDGMKVTVRGVPKLTKWGKFSLTVNAVQPVGKGSIKKAFELLKKKLAAEGLFDPAKKRPLPRDLTKLGVISSMQAAGYADFIKILNARWGGISIQVAHTQVQGMDAAAQIVRALKYFNERGEMQVIAILRGGGSADDLSCFNDEELTRAIAASKIPVITGIGHEVDESLADLAADVRASTPSNAAEMLVRDRKVESEKVKRAVIRAQQFALQQIEFARNENVEKMQKISRGVVMKFIEPMLGDVRQKMDNALGKIQQELGLKEANLKNQIRLIEALNPEKVLRQGYAILAGKMSPGSVVKITTYRQEIEAEIKQVKERK
ncbi:exodeoxyribonuclease VII large subunit [Candidatus Saccharibacteria bacterium]|nr:exodeoxyribonuclease VII large subunit [Candidatus Saccharibacteria bacterium]